MHQNNKRVNFFYASRRVNKNRSSTFYGMMFLFYTNWDFFTTDTFQRLEAIQVQEQETQPNSTTWGDTQTQFTTLQFLLCYLFTH